MRYGPLVPGPYPMLIGSAGRSLQRIRECSLVRERLDGLVDLMLKHADPRQHNYSAIAC